MNDKTEKAPAKAAEKAPAKAAEQPPNKGKVAAKPEPRRVDPVRKWVVLVALVIVALLVWYLLADRFTPFTSQARVRGYVIPISPQVSGNVDAVLVTNNQMVETNQPLLRINDEQYRLGVQRAEAALEAANQEIAALKAGIETAGALVKAAEGDLRRAQADTARQKRIYEIDSGAISVRQLQLAEASLTASEASVEAAKAEQRRAREMLGDDGEENVRLKTARAALARARLELNRTEILAPGRGLVTDVQVDTGNLAVAGRALMTFVAIHDSWIQADLRENNLGHLEPGDPVIIALDVQPGRLFEGRVRSVGYGVASGLQPLGGLPLILEDRDWLRDAQRFPVIVEVSKSVDEQMVGARIGSQATVMVITSDRPMLNRLGRFYMRLATLFSYVY